MNRTQIEERYKVNGLVNYKLRTVADLLQIHQIDFTAVAGYKKLSSEDKELYKRFIVNFFNAFGLASRTTLNPKSVHRCKTYLRFDYEQQKRSEWLHVIDERTWY